MIALGAAVLDELIALDLFNDALLLSVVVFSDQHPELTHVGLI